MRLAKIRRTSISYTKQRSRRVRFFKDAPHPNAAKLYLSWLLDKEQQSQIGTWSSRSDVLPPSGLKPLSEYKIANDFAAFINDEAHANDLRKRFEGYIGPIKGTPTIR
jgi:ABC-type Fe3+ transport system substrate-binding protein